MYEIFTGFSPNRYEFAGVAGQPVTEEQERFSETVAEHTFGDKDSVGEYSPKRHSIVNNGSMYDTARAPAIDNYRFGVWDVDTTGQLLKLPLVVFETYEFSFERSKRYGLWLGDPANIWVPSIGYRLGVKPDNSVDGHNAHNSGHVPPVGLILDSLAELEEAGKLTQANPLAGTDSSPS